MTDFLTVPDTIEETPDRRGTWPHPRETLGLFGHAAAERSVLDCIRRGRLHHAWLITGPEGIGKATFAYRLARYLLANPDADRALLPSANTDLAITASHNVAGQVARMSHPDLAVIARSRTKDGKSYRGEITVDDVRDALKLFASTSGAGGWRIIILDAADDLNRNAANALLKMLEEPPRQALFLIVAHRPHMLLPTIRSRCRVLRLSPLAAGPLQQVITGLARFQGDWEPSADAMAGAGGSVAAALDAMDPEVAAFKLEARACLETRDARRIQTLADKVSGKAGERSFELLLDVLADRLRPRAGVHAARLAAEAALWEKLARSARDVDVFNLDRRPFVLATFADIAEVEATDGRRN
jgi:DNA polymerase III subunit delta'